LEEVVAKTIALVGAGNWGKNHLRNLFQLGVLHTVVDVSSEVLQKWGQEYGAVHFTSELDEVIANPEINGVVIASPAAGHGGLTRKFLLAGKDVLVEKPMALEVAEGEEILQIAEERGRILMVGHILQYHPAVLKLKELVDANELGDIRYIYSNRLNIGKLRTEENVWWSFAPHDISLLLMFMNGQEPLQVSASGGAYVNSNIFDTTMTTLEFANGVKGHIFVSWLHPFKEQKLVVVGSEKMAVFDDVSSEKLQIFPHRIDFVNGTIPVAHKAESHSVEFEAAEPLREELSHFIHCMNSRERARTDGREGLKVLRVLAAAEKSLMEDQV
jgi:UDP-2-acetamido-3-amino-2,3-dideoxy-glucuronate N-acetyltransferase